MSKLKFVALGFVFCWFLFGGVGHFIATDFFVSIVPPYIPYPLAAVYVSGVFELLGAIGILFARWRQLAGLGLLLLIICVTPANLYMWQHPDLFPDFPPALLTVRLVIQVFLIACVIWSTRAPKTQLGKL